MEIQFNPDTFILTLQQIRDNVKVGLKRAAIYLLSEAQKEIKAGGTDWPGFRRPPKRPHQLLYDNGRLMGSLAPNGADNIFEEDGNTVTVSSNLAYAAALNYGYPGRHLPARPFLYIDQGRAEKCADIIRKYLIHKDGS